MNLHDIPARRRPTSVWPSEAEWRRAWAAFDGGFPPLRYQWDAVVAGLPEYRMDRPFRPLDRPFRPLDRPIAVDVDPMDVPTPQFYIENPRDRAAQILADIYAFSGRLYRSDIRQREVEAHLAYRVSPEDYRVLQAYVSVEGGYRGPVYDRERGTMSVMGITVLPSR